MRPRIAWIRPLLPLLLLFLLLLSGSGLGAQERPLAHLDAFVRDVIADWKAPGIAAALGTLVDEGKVRWDDPVTKYLPGFQIYDPYVTRELGVRDLLTHRGGLPRGDRLCGERHELG